MKIRALLGTLFSIAWALACGSTSSGGGECTVDADCGRGSVCGFAKADGCGAKGKCFSAPDATCEAYSPGCACDGTTINIICTPGGDGVVSKPLRSAGACAQATECAVDADCGLGSVCGFAKADGCSAKGKCMPSPGATCAAYSPGCACDGTTINIICTPGGDGVVSKPLRSAGSCASADGGSDATGD
ncbi:MAG: hypothetical protein U0174_14145 [Polyangiaceae bacterium]